MVALVMLKAPPVVAREYVEILVQTNVVTCTYTSCIHIQVVYIHKPSQPLTHLLQSQPILCFENDHDLTLQDHNCTQYTSMWVYVVKRTLDVVYLYERSFDKISSGSDIRFVARNRFLLLMKSTCYEAMSFVLYGGVKVSIIVFCSAIIMRPYLLLCSHSLLSLLHEHFGKG